MADPRITFDSNNIDLKLGTGGVQINYTHEGYDNVAGSGIIESINLYGIINITVDAFFSEATYRNLVAWFSWARQGKTFSFAYDSDKTASTTLDAAAAAGQKNVPLTATTGISAGDFLFIKADDNDDEYEVFEVDSVDTGVKVVSTTNLIYTYASADICRHEKYWSSLILPKNERQRFAPRITNHARQTTDDHYRRHQFKFIEKYS